MSATWQYINNGTEDIRVTTTCPTCSAENHVECKAKDYQSWFEGKVIQEAMPYLPVGQRELLQTGICDSCLTNMFSIGEDMLSAEEV